ncbi:MULTISPECIES: DUF2795 domain-containing protein [Kitasatospora]|uniref:DUF2795 domain-containing protein n=1 Tax=Kitasatospora cathayae TaxID=3004092 RepID=A0ABY7PVT8_9ACTN|nr:DUF2795 domain-containing protein [Kitasatospora sp. HUAS 3-15]WBP84466.1 DUF2795 domain-containing protein [Kitasatospora sp. HUAS 3-15]
MSRINPNDVQRALKGASYPADREELAERARSNGADETLVDQISELDVDSFDGPDEVSQALFRQS